MTGNVSMMMHSCMRIRMSVPLDRPHRYSSDDGCMEVNFFCMIMSRNVCMIEKGGVNVD